MNIPELRTAILASMAKQALPTWSRIDEVSGRFLGKNGGFAIANQGILFPWAMLYLEPSSEIHQQEVVLKHVQRVGDAMRDFQNPNGSWEFVKEDGSSWGPTHMPWPFLPWLETWHLLRDRLGAPRQERWATGLRKWCDAVHRQTVKSRHVHNIPAYNAAILVRASALLDAPQYLQAAADYLRLTADAQHADGFWAEGGVPTASYNHVYGHALGLYYAFTKDEYVLPHLRRYLDFHLHFTYPDGTNVETIDGRVRYHAGPGTMGLLGFLPFPEGRSLARMVVEKVLDRNKDGCLDTGLAFLLQHLAEGASAEIPQTRKAFASVFHEHACVRRSGPFFCCLNAYTAPLEQRLSNSRNRWLMDMQQRISVWHAEAGLIVGGGNSKNQPEFSTFEVFVGGAHYLQPDLAQVRSTAQGEDLLELEFGPVRCELGVTIPDPAGDSVELRFRASTLVPGARVRGGFTLWGVAGKSLKRPGAVQPEQLNPKHALDFSIRAGELLSVGRVELRLPPEAHFSYPVYPFNPYAVEGVSLPEDTVASIWFDLPVINAGGEVVLRVCPETAGVG